MSKDLDIIYEKYLKEIEEKILGLNKNNNRSSFNQFDNSNKEDEVVEEPPLKAAKPCDEYSLQLMKIYSLGFVSIANEDDNEEEKKENDVISDDANDAILKELNKNDLVPPRKKRIQKKAKNNLNGHDEAEEEEEEEEEEADVHKEFNDENFERLPAIYNAWAPDCTRTRQDFLVCQQINMAQINTREEFKEEMKENGFLNSLESYEDYLECLKFGQSRVLQGVESKFNVEIDVSDFFYGLNGTRLRAYSFQGRNRQSVYTAFSYIRDTWPGQVFVNCITDYDITFRADNWYYSVVLVDKKLKSIKEEEGLGDEFNELEEDEEEEMLEPSTEVEDNENNGSITNKKTTEVNVSNKMHLNNNKLQGQRIDFSNKNDATHTESLSELGKVSNETENETANVKKTRIKSINVFKYIQQYLKNSSSKIKKFLTSVLKNDSDSTTNTISNMALLANNNNNISSTKAHTISLPHTQFKYQMINLVLDTNKIPIPIWMKVEDIKQ